jgi:dCMP deaminase
MRESRDQRFMDLCHSALEWGTCPRARVGAIVAQGGLIVSQGYNGAPPGQPHCDDVGCLIIDDHCKRARHAEVNALALAGRERTNGATLYTTHFPCLDCANAIVFYGIARVVYEDSYRIDEHAYRLLLSATRLEQFVDGRAHSVGVLEAVDQFGRKSWAIKGAWTE